MISLWDDQTNVAPRLPDVYREVRQLRRIARRRRRVREAVKVFLMSAVFWVPATIIGLVWLVSR